MPAATVRSQRQAAIMLIIYDTAELEAGARDGLRVRTLIAIAIALAKYKPVTLDEIVGFDGSSYYLPSSQAITREELDRLRQEVKRLREQILSDRD